MSSCNLDGSIYYADPKMIVDHFINKETAGGKFVEEISKLNPTENCDFRGKLKLNEDTSII